jgi:hypothetical protein
MASGLMEKITQTENGCVKRGKRKFMEISNGFGGPLHHAEAPEE